MPLVRKNAVIIVRLLFLECNVYRDHLRCLRTYAERNLDEALPLVQPSHLSLFGHASAAERRYRRTVSQTGKLSHHALEGRHPSVKRMRRKIPPPFGEQRRRRQAGRLGRGSGQVPPSYNVHSNSRAQIYPVGSTFFYTSP